LQRKLSGIVERAMRRFGVPGVSAALVEHCRVAWGEGFGFCTGGGRVTARTVCAVASLSKPPFAYTVIGLCNRGLFDLDTPLAELYPKPYAADGLDPQTPELRQVTARHVLCHTSGMGNWEEGDVGRLSFLPGSRWHYSGEGYVYLQWVVEHGTGLALEQLAADELFQPLQMPSSTFLWRPTGDGGNGVAGTCAAEGTELSRAYASHSLHTTAADYARFVAHVLRSEVGQTMLMPQVEIDDSLAWGLGWGLADGIVWHWGEMGRFQSAAVASPSDGQGLVCLTNGEQGLAACADIFSGALGDDFAYPVRAVLERGW
jgi:CubicO group peptidase (beta-lactamase class C family)